MNFWYFLGWCAYRTLFQVYFRWRVYNPGRVPLEGGVILASNHASFLDPPLVGAGLRRGINYLARENLAARDQRDSQRAAAPLMIALGAKVIDNSRLTAEETSALIIADIRKRLGGQGTGTGAVT